MKENRFETVFKLFCFSFFSMCGQFNFFGSYFVQNATLYSSLFRQMTAEKIRKKIKQKTKTTYLCLLAYSSFFATEKQ